MNFSRVVLLLLIASVLSYKAPSQQRGGFRQGGRQGGKYSSSSYKNQYHKQGNNYPRFNPYWGPSGQYSPCYGYPHFHFKSHEDLMKILANKSEADSFKANISQIIGDITQFKTPEGINLTQTLTHELHEIYKILEQKNQLHIKQCDNSGFDTKLRTVVKSFLQTIDKIQQYLQKNVPVVVKGDHNRVTGKNTVVGEGNNVEGTSNVAVGNSNMVAGDSGILKGDKNVVIGNDSFIIGHNNTAKGNNTYIFSFDKKVDKSNALVVGNYEVDLKKYS